MQANVDSQRYIIAYELHSRDEAPADFCPREALPEFHAGLFLPRAEPDWIGRSAYPPRLPALVAGGLAIVPHAAAKAAEQTLSFESICFVESGSMLLHGWLRLVCGDFDRTLFYNRRNAVAVDAFLRRLRTALLGDSHPCGEPGIALGDPLDLKFRYALAHEMDEGEPTRASLFRAAADVTRRPLGFKRISTIPADLVALTSRQMLWITDRSRWGYARYGSIARYAALSRIAAMARVEDGGEGTITVTFQSPEVRWHIPLSPRHRHDADILIAQCRQEIGPQGRELDPAAVAILGTRMADFLSANRPTACAYGLPPTLPAVSGV